MTSKVVPCFQWSYLWKVESFPSSLDQKITPGINIKLRGVLNTKCSLELFKYGFCGKPPVDNVGVRLNLGSSYERDFEVKVTLSIVDRLGNSHLTNRIDVKLELKNSTCTMSLGKLNDFQGKYNELLAGDCLSILCAFSAGEHENTWRRVTPPNQTLEVVGLNDVKNNGDNLHWQFFLSQTFVDATVIVREKEFKVHRLVLATHSKVFSAMFTADMVEGISKSVTINDCDPKVFMEFLRYAYSNQVENIDRVARRLLVFCEKYEVESLKLLCEKTIEDSLTVSNVFDTLDLADAHRSTWLKARSMDFITANIPKITSTQEWRNWTGEPQLLKEVIQNLAQRTSTT